LLVVLIVPFSVASFVASALSDAIRQDIKDANPLAVRIVGAVHPTSSDATSALPLAKGALPPGVSAAEVITELQQFAALIRSVDGRARRLNYFVLRSEADPFAHLRDPRDPNKVKELREKLQLPVDLPTQLPDAFDKKIPVFQDVRYFAQSVTEDVATFYGAITTCVLPVLYALLGTCAYLLRQFERTWSAKTFVPSPAHSARFLIAGIGGAVVGLFNNFAITKEPSIPPLAIAFLVGYAVEIFFAFLENLMGAFTQPPDRNPTPSKPESTSGSIDDSDEVAPGLA
jgi:hypothetical protein